ncbi:nuclear pore assembly and biogenesis-domain-containing protein [Aspergillus taichungensis]|uniref:Nuclear pore assembly and biogenesis-domain-containing protein n=1 Tax=Aspergillus taichungensis TaxID=482145 RepID=A0A2J5HVV0_9EURO|nr:nuclear pore assembly and biogenesis-domain-containing protein [Aspergillus taichungensis]
MDYLPEQIQTLLTKATTTLPLDHPLLKNLTTLALPLGLPLTLPTTEIMSHLRETYLNPYIIDPLSTLLTTACPDYISVLLLVTILFISLKILDYARRVVLFWVGLVVRLLWWSAIFAAGYYVYTVGLVQTGRDVGWVLGALGGFVEGFWEGVEGGRGGSTSSSSSSGSSRGGWV